MMLPPPPRPSHPARPGPGRRAVLASLLAAPAVARAGGAMALRDLAGREVVLPRPARRLLLGEGRFVHALALLEADPIALVAGWRDDFRLVDPEGLEHVSRLFPAARQVPRIAGSSHASFSVERALELRPDLALFGLGSSPAPEVLAALDRAGIPALVIDFRLRPLAHVAPSLRLLGRALGREERAEAFVALHESRLAEVARRLPASGARPSVLMEYRPTADRGCCRVPGRDGVGEILAQAGGRNVAGNLPGPVVELGVEHVLAADPDVYVITGASARGEVGVRLGYGVLPEEARASLRRTAARSAMAELAAVRTGRVHGLWHNVFNSPCGAVALEVLAKWLHPETCADLDPAGTLAAINGRFLSIPMTGVFWTDLD